MPIYKITEVRRIGPAYRDRMAISCVGMHGMYTLIGSVSKNGMRTAGMRKSAYPL